MVLLIYQACSDDIYYTISKEVPIIPPLIKGSPTNFVDYNGKMYVASEKTLWEYDYKINTGKRWKSSKFSRHIIQLAATSANMYALCLEDSEKRTDRKIYQRTGTGAWNEIKLSYTGDYNKLQSIYAVNDVLYIGTQKKDNSNEFNILRNIGDKYEELLSAGTNNAILYGVASDSKTTYLCTGSGIFNLENETGTRIGSNIEFRGIITLSDDSIAAITSEGTLYRIDSISVCTKNDCKEVFGPDVTVCSECQSATAKEKKFTTITRIQDRWASGAIAVWSQANTIEQLLLVGRRETEYSSTTGHTNGYLELKLYNAKIGVNPTKYFGIADYYCNNSQCREGFKKDTISKEDLQLMKCPSCYDGSPCDEEGCEGGDACNHKKLILNSNSFREPGKTPPTTVGDNERYISSLGKVPVNHIFQAEDGVLFAATQKEGVWSYRKRDGVEMWNSETQ